MLEELEPLLPIDFFSIAAPLRYSKELSSSQIFCRPFMLPDNAQLLAEESFAKMAIAWNEDGLLIQAFIKKPFEASDYPQYQDGDSLELFIDTRDLKTAGYMGKFCHHFLILSQEVQGVRTIELSRFRNEDSHPLCDPSELEIETQFDKGSYLLKVAIPSTCLHGFDPASFDRMGFTYRLNRYKGPPQHFSVSSSYFSIEQHPSLWASFQLIK